MKKSNSGKHLKVLAVVLGIVIVVAGILISHKLIFGLLLRFARVTGRMYCRSSLLFGAGVLISMVIGYLVAIGLYAFGEIVENSALTAERTEKAAASLLAIEESLKRIQKKKTEDIPETDSVSQEQTVF